MTYMTDLDIRVNFLKVENLMLLKFKTSEQGKVKGGKCQSLDIPFKALVIDNLQVIRA